VQGATLIRLSPQKKIILTLDMPKIVMQHFLWCWLLMIWTS
jgi:hypothetical protein